MRSWIRGRYFDRAAHVHELAFGQDLAVDALVVAEFVDADDRGVADSIEDVVVDLFGDGSEGFMDMRGVLNFVSKLPGALDGVFRIVHTVRDISIYNIVDLQ
jgi:hypothetical protein